MVGEPVRRALHDGGQRVEPLADAPGDVRRRNGQWQRGGGHMTNVTEPRKILQVFWGVRAPSMPWPRGGRQRFGVAMIEDNCRAIDTGGSLAARSAKG